MEMKKLQDRRYFCKEGKAIFTLVIMLFESPAGWLVLFGRNVAFYTR